MDFLLPLVNFAFVSSITPGPNNVMLSASGVAFGFKRTLPHLGGVVIGFALLLVVCGAGVGSIVLEFPMLGLALKLLGSGYLLYLAWALRTAIVPQVDAASARPLRFVEALLFQFINPKAWIMGITAVSVFLPDWQPPWLAVAAVCGVFVLVGLPCIATWAVLGMTLRRWLANARWRNAFGIAIALLMVYSVVAIWI